MFVLPLVKPRLPPIVIPSSEPPELLSSVPSLLTIVPLASVPVSVVRPPAPGPAAPMSSVLPPRQACRTD